MKVHYIAPMYEPAAGGGVQYFRMLGTYVCSEPDNEFVLVTEKYPGASATESFGRFTVRRFFPYRAGRSSKDLWSYFAYAVQNFLFPVSFLNSYMQKIDVLIIHSSFHNNPNILAPCIWMLKKLNRDIVVAGDFRDPRLEPSKFKSLRYYDKVISCSDNVTSHLLSGGISKSKLVQMRIPIEERKEDSDIVLRDEIRFEKSSYVFNGSGCSREKGIVELVATVREMRKSIMGLKLVVAGRQRYTDASLLLAEQEGWFICTGPISHDETVQLARDCLIDINLSTVDSMPRHTLEAMAVGAKVLVPDGIPEFKAKQGNHVVRDRSDPLECAKQALEIVASEATVKYDVSLHYPENAFARLEQILIH